MTEFKTTEISSQVTVVLSGKFSTQLRFLHAGPKISSYAIPLVAYSSLGIEIVAVAAFEAKYSWDLKWPSRFIAYFVFALYFLCTIGEALNTKWNSDHLPSIYGGVGNSSTTAPPPANPRSTNLIVNAAWTAGHKDIAGFLNGCLLFSVLSASNTSLYVSSRTLYGMTREIPDTNWFGKWIHKLSLVVPQTGVPAAALLFSAASFYWLPFLSRFGKAISIADVSSLSFMSSS
jgi:amino acid transporter